MEQVAEVVPMVQILDIPVPQMAEQLLEVFRLLDTQMPVEHVIAVPTISLDRIPQRLVERRLPQMVEQLMEVPSSGLLSSSFPVVVLVVFQGLSQDRCQQRLWLSRLPTFLLPVEVLTIFSPDRVLQRPSPRMLNFWLVVVFTTYAQDRVLRRFLQLNTAMMLLGVHAEVEDLFEVLKALSQDIAQQPEVELVIAGLLAAWTRRLRLHRVQCGGRPSSFWWVSSPRLVAGALRRRRFRDVLCPEGSGRLHDIEAVGRE